MWGGKDKEPPCITIFSAPNYCGHMNLGSIFVTGPNMESRVLTYEESKTKRYYLIDRETSEYPEEPFDAFRWFMPTFSSLVAQVFNVITSKINSYEDEPETESTSSPTVINSQKSLPLSMQTPSAPSMEESKRKEQPATTLDGVMDDYEAVHGVVR